MTDAQLTYIGPIDAVVDDTPIASGHAASWRGRLAYAFRPASRLPVYLGVGLSALGFVVLGIGWLEVALQSDVWRQVPYVMSAGFPGIGLILVGLVMVNVGVRRHDGAATRRALAAVAEAVRNPNPEAGR